MNELEILNHALTQPLGVKVATNNPVALKQTFYRLKRQHPHLASLSFLTSRDKPDSEIWIAHAQTGTTTAGSEETGPAV